VSTDPLKCTFGDTIFRPLWGAAPWKTRYRLTKACQRTPKLRGGPPKNCDRENLKFGLKFSVWATITTALVGVSSWNFFQSTCRMSRVITRVQFLEGPPPKVCEGEKNVQNSAQFLTTFHIDREYLRNGSTYRKSEKKNHYQRQHLPRWAKKMVNFGPQTTEWKWLILTNQSGHFSGDYISAIRGCCTLKFLNALEIDPGYRAHTPTWTRVPPKNFNREHLKFGLKFSVWATITSWSILMKLFPVDVPQGRGDNVGTIFGRPAP